MADELSAAEIAALIASVPEMEPVEEDSEKLRSKRRHIRRTKYRLNHIALLDFETDPADNTRPDERLEPFVCALYSDDFQHVIWDDDFHSLIDKIFTFIESLDEPYVFYAHNGGKFDYRFMEYKLRGQVSYKGSSLMRAQIGKCEIRDSLHILPIKLKEYNKEQFDYEKMRKKSRHKYREEIIKYVLSDCKNTLDLIKKFVKRHGFKISVGAAALAKLREHYKIENVAGWTDDKLRPYFRGGRVECLAGAGLFEGNYLYLDVNSMYPDVMAHVKHPIGREYVFRDGKPSKNTFFLTIECDNDGALLTFDEHTKELNSEVRHGIFKTTIHEYQAALELGLIRNVRFIECVDNFVITDFSKFVLPRYHDREVMKAEIEHLKQIGEDESQKYLDLKANDLLVKFELNNAYGKTAQNPRRFKEYVFTDPGKHPDENELGGGWDLYMSNDEYWVHWRPNPDVKFLNVGTGASITGAARAKLLRAIHAAKNPIYCDTDSLVCEDLPGFQLSEEGLGAWKIEARVKRMIVAGKKTYAFEDDKGKKKYRSKGTANLEWNDYLEMLIGNDVIKVAKFPTLTRTGDQHYLTRSIRATARIRDVSKIPVVKSPNEGKAIA